MIISSVTIPNSGLADCKSDCERVISAADAALKARDGEIAAQKTAIDDLTNDLVATQARLNADTAELHAWYRNPFILIPLGVLVGGATTLYLKK